MLKPCARFNDRHCKLRTAMRVLTDLVTDSASTRSLQALCSIVQAFVAVHSRCSRLKRIGHYRAFDSTVQSTVCAE